MSFNSLQFLIFFPVVCVLYFIMPQKWRWALLLVASYYFYMSWNAKLVWLIAFTTLVSYGSAIFIERHPESGVRKVCLIVTLCACFGTLFFFKYFNFFAGSIMALFGKNMALNLLLPVGISFYTFQTLSYVIDVYPGDTRAEFHLGYYALYVSFFPQLVAGPIERPENLLPQLRTAHRFSNDDFVQGLRYMLCGFFKKVVVADMLAVYVERVYAAPGDASAPALILATVLFAAQIYGDFSGYSDIAVGCARILGIRLMKNFDMPYSAKSCREFWARWHISLSTWFRDYLYIPLGGNRRGLPRTYLNLMIVFTVSGLWHGAAWTFLIWGMLHGVYQVAERWTYTRRMAFWHRLGVNTKGRIFGAWQTFCTFLLVDFAFIFFRANSLRDLRPLMKALFTKWQFSGTLAFLGLDGTGVVIILASLLVMRMLDILLLQKRRVRAGGESRAVVGAMLTMTVGAAWLLLLGSGGASSFIYFRF